jgi:Zn-dependent protease
MQNLVVKIRPTPGLVVGLGIAAVLAVVTGGASPAAIGGAGVLIGALVGSVSLHELSHAVAARRAGMTVDCIRLSLLGGITAYSGPDPGPQVLRRIALAGPKASFAAAGVCLLILVAESATGWRSAVGSMAAWGLQFNLVLGAINLLPFGSLDGAALREARRR